MKVRQNEIWVVEGSTGEYSDSIQWPVAFYFSHKEAQIAVEFLSKMKDTARSLLRDGSDGSEIAFMKQFDPRFRADYTGTNYICYRVRLGRDFSQVEMTDEKLQMLINMTIKSSESR